MADKKLLMIFLNRLVKRKYPDVNEIIVTGRDIGNGNFDYSVFVHPTWEGHSKLSYDENFEEELFKYIKRTDSEDLQVVDSDNDYFINELGFRGKIKSSPEIIGIGCSFTFGMGVPENGVWTNILADSVGIDILNLGAPGHTVKKICELAIGYISKYNKPKTIFAFSNFPSSFYHFEVDYFHNAFPDFPVCFASFAPWSASRSRV